MKKIIFTVVGLCSLYFASNAQCEKNIKLESSKTEYLDRSGSVMRVMDDQAVVTVTKKEIIITPSSDHVMKGEIKSSTCDWKVPYKEGKWTINAIFFEDGANKAITIVFEGKNNKVSMTLTMDDDSDKVIRVWADKFEEVKQ